jgi:hypothetical protein
MHPVVTWISTSTAASGRNTARVSSGFTLARTAMVSATITTCPTGSAVHVTKRLTAVTSSRKRLTASPGDRGTARAAGSSRMRSGRLRWTSVA